MNFFKSPCPTKEHTLFDILRNSHFSKKKLYGLFEPAVRQLLLSSKRRHCAMHPSSTSRLSGDSVWRIFTEFFKGQSKLFSPIENMLFIFVLKRVLVSKFKDVHVLADRFSVRSQSWLELCSVLLKNCTWFNNGYTSKWHC